MPPTLLPSTAAETGGVLTIDLAAVEANWKKLYGMTVGSEEANKLVVAALAELMGKTA